MPDYGKPRVRILIQGLRENGIEVIECTDHVWEGIEDKSQIRSLATWIRLACRLFVAWPKLIFRYLRLPKHDWVLICYPSLLDLLIIHPFARLRGARTAMDWFISAYDTLVCDRKLLSARNPAAMLVWLLEWLTSHLANMPFMDTAAHARRVERLFRLRHGTCGYVFVGAEDVFAPNLKPATTSKSVSRTTKVLFYGQFIPLHGVETIVSAAALLRNVDIEWTLIGTGQESAHVNSILSKLEMPRLRRIPWVPYHELARALADSDICLGIFGTSEKASSVIPNKVFQILSFGRPLITRDSPAIREIVSPHGDVILVPPGNAEALAAAVLQMRKHLSTRLPKVAALPTTVPTALVVGRQLANLLEHKPS